MASPRGRRSFLFPRPTRSSMTHPHPCGGTACCPAATQQSWARNQFGGHRKGTHPGSSPAPSPGQKTLLKAPFRGSSRETRIIHHFPNVRNPGKRPSSWDAKANEKPRRMRRLDPSRPIFRTTWKMQKIWTLTARSPGKTSRSNTTPGYPGALRTTATHCTVPAWFDDEVLHWVSREGKLGELHRFTEWAVKAYRPLLGCRTSGGLTPIHLAIAKGNHEFVGLVLSEADSVAALLMQKN